MSFFSYLMHQEHTLLENTVAKGEIVHDEQYAFPSYRPFLTLRQQTAFENIVTKEEIAQNELSYEGKG